MKNVRKFAAALIVLTMVLSLLGTAFAASAKFTKNDVGSDASVYAKFKGSLYAYNKHSASSKSKIIVKKGSVAKVVGVYGKKWVQLQLTHDLYTWDEKKDEDVLVEAGKKMWFGVDKLARVTKESEKQTRVVFSAGGSGLSKAEWEGIYDAEVKAKGKVKVTSKTNLRKHASLQGKSQGVVKKGTKLTLTGYCGEDTRGIAFFQVKYKGKKYYISAESTNLKDLGRYLAFGE